MKTTTKNLTSKRNEAQDEYWFLTSRLEVVKWALAGQCDDIDCDKYMYRDLLKKKYKPVLEHNYSCMQHLQWEKAALMRILSLARYKKHRYEQCGVCRKPVDKLDDEKSTIVSYTRPTEKGYYRWEGVWCHNQCEKKFKIPEGWKQF